jgi:hypothetical protein
VVSLVRVFQSGAPVMRQTVMARPAKSARRDSRPVVRASIALVYRNLLADGCCQDDVSVDRKAGLAISKTAKYLFDCERADFLQTQLHLGRSPKKCQV